MRIGSPSTRPESLQIKEKEFRRRLTENAVTSVISALR